MRLAAFSSTLCALALASCGPRACGTCGSKANPESPDRAAAANDPSRRCGESGSTPTELPALLAAGGERLGSVVLAPGGESQLGSINFKYDSDAWIGTMEVGSRGPALETLIDRAEAGDGPWGAQTELSPGATFLYEIGPYAFSGRAGDGSPPASVSVAALRRICPRAQVVDRLDASSWIWLSTEGIQLATFRPQTDMVQASISALPAAPGVRIDLSTLEYRRSLVPEPGRELRVLAPGYLFTIDRVVAGAGTRFEAGSWTSTGAPSVSARIRVEAHAGTPWDAPAPSAVSACGEPVEGRGGDVPRDLAAPLGTGEAATLEVGRSVRAGGVSLELSEKTLPPRPYREPETYRELRVSSDGSAARSFPVADWDDRVYRLGRTIVAIPARTDRGAGGAMRAVVARTACVDAAQAEMTASPTTVWLSTRGFTQIVIEGDGPTNLSSAALSIDGRGVHFSVSANDGYASADLTPSAVGRAFEIGGARYEIAEIVAGPGTRFEGGEWVSNDIVPAVHVALVFGEAQTNGGR